MLGAVPVRVLAAALPLLSRVLVDGIVVVAAPPLLSRVLVDGAVVAAAATTTVHAPQSLVAAVTALALPLRGAFVHRGPLHLRATVAAPSRIHPTLVVVGRLLHRLFAELLS